MEKIMEPTADIALIGLAVMDQNLILNMSDHGYTVVAYNRTVSKVDEFLNDAYIGLAGAALAAGEADRAAVVVDEMALLFGMPPDTVERLRVVYGRVAGGACALAAERGQMKLNMDCARVARDVCAGWGGPGRAVRERAPGDMAARRREEARGRGCRVALDRWFVTASRRATGTGDGSTDCGDGTPPGRPRSAAHPRDPPRRAPVRAADPPGSALRGARRPQSRTRRGTSLARAHAARRAPAQPHSRSACPREPNGSSTAPGP